MNIQGVRALVVGMKKSGVASAEFLARRGAAVSATDLKPIEELPGVRELGIPFAVQTPAVFSMIGAKPCTSWLPAGIQLDERGFIKTGSSVASLPAWKAMDRVPGPLETSWPGIFAAGDVRSGSVKRCAAAVGEGGMAVEGVHEVLKTYS